jgi:hypothetical protein
MGPDHSMWLPTGCQTLSVQRAQKISSAQLSEIISVFGTPGEIRTPDPQIRKSANPPKLSMNADISVAVGVGRAGTRCWTVSVLIKIAMN